MTAVHSSPDALIGQIISGQYRIEQVLGQGGMGTVYRGTQLSVGRPVAIKVINADALNNEQLRTRFAREAQALSRLTHPNTVRLFDYGMTEQQQPFMVMELLQGNDVSTEIERHGPMPQNKALRVTLQVLRALQEAHAQGMTHRDLKPSNIFLTQIEGSDVFAKVLDFGIAGFDQLGEGQKLTVTGIVMGSAAYMSPEQAQGTNVGPASDLYSVGAVLFEMLTASPPFKAETMVSMLVAHITQPPPRLDMARPELDAAPAVQQLIDDLMAKTPEQRPASAKIVADRIEAQLSAQTLPSAVHGYVAPQNPVPVSPGTPGQGMSRPVTPQPGFAAPAAARAPTPDQGNPKPNTPMQGAAQVSGGAVASSGSNGDPWSPAVSAPHPRGAERNSHAPLYAGLGALAVLGVGALGWVATRSPATNQSEPLVSAAPSVITTPNGAVAAAPALPTAEQPLAAAGVAAEPVETTAASAAPGGATPARAQVNPATPKSFTAAPSSPRSAPVAVAATTAAPVVRTPPVASSHVTPPVAVVVPAADPALSSTDRATRRQALLRTAPRYTSVAAAKSALNSGALTRESYEDTIWVLKNLREVALRAAKADYKSHKIDKETYRARVDEIEGRYRGL
jgi:serine/threonine protein kinase